MINHKSYHHFYLNCNCTVASYLGGDVILSYSNLSTAMKNNWKLKLRPLHDIKEVEAIECGLYSKREQWHEMKWAEAQIRLKQFDDLTLDIDYSSKQFAYLLSKHFDVFGLIGNGLAVSKNNV